MKGRRQMGNSQRWRTGRKLGRTLYVQISSTPSDKDIFIGIMDTREAAELVVKAVNYFLDLDG